MAKVEVIRDTSVWINGVRHDVKAGIQELENHVAELLLQLGLAKAVEEKKDDKRRRG